jgi:serine/threonine-protein kinase
MLATGLPYAPDTWSRVRARLDAHADAWAAGRVDACRAAEDGGATEAQSTRRVRCLERQRAELEALVEVLAQADATTVERASAAVAGLPRAHACADPQALLDVPAEPEDPELLALNERYLHVSALEKAGRYQEALAPTEALVADVEAHGDPALLVDSLGILALLRGTLEPVKGEQTMRRAYFEAVRHHQDGTAARLATSLVFVTGYTQARTEAALEWAAHADAAIDRAGGQPRTRIKLLKNVGDVHARNAALPLAQEHYERALALVTAQIDEGLETHETMAHDELMVLTGLAMARFERGEHAEALEHLERALGLAEEVLGPAHPDVGRIHNELGNVAFRQERADDARRHYERALELWAVAYGPRAPARVMVLTNLGNLADTQGRLADARERYEQALAMAEQLFGRDHVDVAFVLVNLGILHEHAGEPELAVERFGRALALRDKALGAEHPKLVNPLLGLARAELSRGDAAAARGHAERALVLRRADGGEDGAGVAEVLVTLGQALMRQGELEEGRARLERVLELCETHECADAWTGRASMELARVLGADEAERKAKLLERARADLRRAGVEGALDLEALARAEATAER